MKKQKYLLCFLNFLGGYHITYPNNHFRVCSVIEHDCSYGRKQDLLEIEGLLTKKEMNRKQDDVLGYLTAENVFQRIENHWKSIKG